MYEKNVDVEYRTLEKLNDVYHALPADITKPTIALHDDSIISLEWKSLYGVNIKVFVGPAPENDIIVRHCSKENLTEDYPLTKLLLQEWLTDF